LHRVTQDVHLSEGENDHLFPISRLGRVIRELVCARSITARVFTAREGAEQHCAVGNGAAAREEFVSWLSRFHDRQPPKVTATGARPQQSRT
jgi:hypothetical protein